MRHDANPRRVNVYQKVVISGDLCLEQSFQTVHVLGQWLLLEVYFFDFSLSVREQIKSRDGTSEDGVLDVRDAEDNLILDLSDGG